MKTLYKKAFTMLELIFVIVILGIVASIGSSMIAQTFEGYLMQRAVHSASIKTELAINQLANRLTYYMRDSLLARIPGTTTLPVLGSLGDAIPLSNVPAGDNDHTMLEWIAYDNDGFTTTRDTPAWSGVCDLGGVTDFTSIVTPASRLKNAAGTSPSEKTILTNLFPSMTRPAIRFLTDNYRTGTPYNIQCMYQTNGTGCMFPVTLADNTTLDFITPNGGDRTTSSMIYSEFYQLSGSAYAVVPIDPADSTAYTSSDLGNTTVPVWDLYLYYDYQPWDDENYTDATATRKLIAHNVSVFRFRQEGNTIRLKLCMVEQISDTETISICKEKAVLR